MDILGCETTHFFRYLGPAHLCRLTKLHAKFSGLNGGQNSTGQYISWNCGTAMPAPGAISRDRCLRYFRILSRPARVDTSPMELTRRSWAKLLGLQCTSNRLRMRLLRSQNCHREPDVGYEQAYCEPVRSKRDNDAV